MKFTEEQYQEIINFDSFKTVYRLGLVDSFVGEIIPFISNNDLQQEAMALANPLTREWAHDKFVEKEKKYYWNSIKTDLIGNHSRLYRGDNGNVSAYSRYEPANDGKDERLTESEIKSWGYNPEMLDREEVQ